MNKILLFLIFLCIPVNLFAQEENEIINLFGISDSTGKYYLIYEDVINVWNHPWGKKINFIDLDKNIDSVIVKEDGWWQHDFGVRSILDYDFLNNNPNNIVYTQYLGTGFGNIVFNNFFDLPQTHFYNGSSNLIINNSNPNLIYLTTIDPGGYSSSTDSGKTWSLDNDSTYLQTFPYNLLSLYPNTDSTMFGIDSLGNLLKSYDAGLTSEIVEESGNWDFLRENIYYDKDGKHIYAITKKDEHYFIYVSDNYGNKGSWNQLENSLNKLSLSVDKEVSGNFIFSNKNKIFESNDYGISYNLKHELNYNISGIFNVPNTDSIFASTRFAIWLLTKTSIAPIKQVLSKESLAYYPLHVGDKWNYEVEHITGWGGDEINYSLTREVLIDTIFTNQKKYYKIKESRSDTNQTHIYYEQIDSLNGKVYRVNNLFADNNEYLVWDLVIEEEMSFSSWNFYIDSYLEEDLFRIEKSTQRIFENPSFSEEAILYETEQEGTTHGTSYILAKDIGKSYQYSSWLDGFDEYHYLKSACINGIKYGDTTLVGIDKKQLILPDEFSLLQNYPNPFNPTTTIEYTIPAVVKENFPSLLQNVQLKIYDILGREVSTLINNKQKTGNYKIVFDASNLSSGIYYYSLRINNNVSSKKMVFLK